MRMRPFLLAAVLACAAGSLRAQDDEPERAPTLLRIAAAPNGVVLSVDSGSILRTADSTFQASTVYQFPPDVAQRYGVDTQIESQEMDCGRTLVRGHHTIGLLNERLVGMAAYEEALSDTTWKEVSQAEAPLFGAVCRYLLGSFAMQMKPTNECDCVAAAPELTNTEAIRRALAREYPPRLRDAGIQGTVVLRMRVRTDGSVDTATVRAVRATDPAFAAAAARVALQMRFRPATLNGQPVRVWATIPVSFHVLETPSAERDPSRPDRPRDRFP